LNPWIDVVARLARREARYEAMLALSGGSLHARRIRGRPLSPDRVDALVRWLSHPSPAVRRCCLELLDLHPSPPAVEAIARCLEDPVPRVRWHAVHTISCDVCKAGASYLDQAIRARLETVASSDPSPKVRAQASLALRR
jgi:HEAT repeat protein